MTINSSDINSIKRHMKQLEVKIQNMQNDITITNRNLNRVINLLIQKKSNENKEKNEENMVLTNEFHHLYN